MPSQPLGEAPFEPCTEDVSNGRVVLCTPRGIAYVIDATLGRGAWGEVVLGHSGRPPHGRVAIKCYSRSRLLRQRSVARAPDGTVRAETGLDKVHREVAVLRHLGQHPCIVALHRALCDEEGGTIYVVLDFVDAGEVMTVLPASHPTADAAAGAQAGSAAVSTAGGGGAPAIASREGAPPAGPAFCDADDEAAPLDGAADDAHAPAAPPPRQREFASRLSGRALPLSAARAAIADLLAALAYAHARGVAHRDVKPENALMTSSGVLRLADWGCARRFDAPAPAAAAAAPAAARASGDGEGAVPLGGGDSGGATSSVCDSASVVPMDACGSASGCHCARGGRRPVDVSDALLQGDGDVSDSGSRCGDSGGGGADTDGDMSADDDMPAAPPALWTHGVRSFAPCTVTPAAVGGAEVATTSATPGHRADGPARRRRRSRPRSAPGWVTDTPGTLLFLPPEAVSPGYGGGGSGGYDAYAADVWAAGVTAYVLLFGVLPFGGSAVGPLEAAAAIASAPLLPLPTHRACDPSEWAGGGAGAHAQAFLSALLERDALRRPTAAEALRLPFVASASEAAAGDGVEAWDGRGPVDSAAALRLLPPLPRTPYPATDVRALPRYSTPELAMAETAGSSEVVTAGAAAGAPPGDARGPREADASHATPTTAASPRSQDADAVRVAGLGAGRPAQRRWCASQ